MVPMWYSRFDNSPHLPGSTSSEAEDSACVYMDGGFSDGLSEGCSALGGDWGFGRIRSSWKVNMRSPKDEQ